MSAEELVIGGCDDDPQDVERICQEVVRCVKLLGRQAPILHTCQNGQEILEICQRQKIDLVFLDLELPGWSGFDLAGQLYTLHPTIKIVFISNHENMVFESFEYAPLWFVRKSALESDMLKAAKKYFKITEKVQIRYKTKEGMRDFWISLEEVLYIECEGHTIWIRMLRKECHQVYGSLKALEESFSPYGFVRTNRNYLVNARYVKEIGKRSIQLIDGTELDIGRNRRKEIAERIRAGQCERKLY